MDELAFRSIFTKTLWERRRGLLAWSIGIAALVMAMLSVWPPVRDEYGKLIENYPEGLLAFLGVDKGGLGSARGYLQAELFGLMVPLTLLGYAIAACSAIIAGEEEHGTLNMLLAQPVSRARVVLEKYAAIVLGIAVLSAVLAVVLGVATRVFGVDVNVVDQLAATASAFLLASMFGAITLALGCATGHRTAAAGGASALAVAAYLLTSLAGLVEGLRRFRPLSPFWWYSGNDPLRNGLSALHVVLLVAVTVCALSVAVYAFVRRDIH